MSFTPASRRSGIIRLPILDANDESVPQWIRDKYAGRRCVIQTEGYGGRECNLVAGGPAPPPHHHPQATDP
jgi:hypothetical protein